MILGRHRSREVDRAAGDVGMNIDPAGKDDEAGVYTGGRGELPRVVNE
jgi:hypothetical protein